MASHVQFVSTGAIVVALVARGIHLGPRFRKPSADRAAPHPAALLALAFTAGSGVMLVEHLGAALRGWPWQVALAILLTIEAGFVALMIAFTRGRKWSDGQRFALMAGGLGVYVVFGFLTDQRTPWICRPRAPHAGGCADTRAGSCCCETDGHDAAVWRSSACSGKDWSSSMNNPKYSALLAAFALLATAAATADEIPFPEGFRNWTHIRSAVVGPTSSGFPRFGGMHSIYANAAAMEGYRTGRYPSGSVIVFDNHETVTFQGAELAGKRQASLT